MEISSKASQAKADRIGITEVRQHRVATVKSLLICLVAHPLLAGIEAKFMADYGRDWLRHPHAARLAIVVGSRNVNGLKMFDPRMAWQVTSSFFIVCGSTGGAFILSCKRIPQSVKALARRFWELTGSEITHLQWDSAAEVAVMQSTW